METDFNLLASSHVAQLTMFQGIYQETRAVYELRFRKSPNLAELAVIMARGGRRVPHWLRYLRAENALLKQPLHIITEQQLYEHHQSILQKLMSERVVPATKSKLFAAYLSGNVCATASSLSAFAGISISSSHRWLQRCVEADLLDTFKTDHEIYYLQPDLLQLVIIGVINRDSVFHQQLIEDLRKLRLRSRFWLQTSQLATRFITDFRSV